MKKLLGTSAIAVVAMSMASGAMAQQVTGQSVLERVLNSINTTSAAPVNGTFANIAENLPVLGSTTNYSKTVDATTTVLSQSQYDAQLLAAETAAKASVTTTYDATTGAAIYTYGLTHYSSLAAAQQAAVASAASTFSTGWTATASGVPTILNAINGSVTNTMSGIDGTTANVNGTVTALQAPTVSIGNIATTALGAVNTGTTSLGVNASVAEALAGTSTAVNNTVTQIGGSANTGALVLNVASNATEVTGAVNNTMAGLNGTIGTISTTALGAVNTGTITNGVNAAANGVVAGIVGTAP